MIKPAIESLSCSALMPNFLIIGAPRCGTTSLYQWLIQHPQVFLPDQKEPTYFAAEDGSAPETNPVPDRYTRTLQDYISLFVNAKGKSALGEASTLYFQVPESAQRIKSLIPDVKLIVILRDPAERAFSHYRLHRQSGHEPIENFRAALELEDERISESWRKSFLYISPGFYARHLKTYRRQFSNEQLLVLFFEDLQRDPNSLMTRISRFIGIDHEFQYDTSEAYNSAGIPKNPIVTSLIDRTLQSARGIAGLVPKGIRHRFAVKARSFNLEHPNLSTQDRDYLINIYRDDICELESLTGRDLKSWRSVENSIRT